MHFMTNSALHTLSFIVIQTFMCPYLGLCCSGKKYGMDDRQQSHYQPHTIFMFRNIFIATLALCKCVENGENVLLDWNRNKWLENLLPHVFSLASTLVFLFLSFSIIYPLNSLFWEFVIFVLHFFSSIFFVLLHQHNHFVNIKHAILLVPVKSVHQIL